jgi:hypothetical protein
MSDLSALQKFVDGILSENPRIETALEGRPRLAGLEAAEPRQDGTALPFSAFIPEHTLAAVLLAQSLGQLVDLGEAVTENGAPTEALAGIVREVRAAPAVPRDDALLRHAIKLFTTHHPVGRRLEVQPLEVRAPMRALTATVGGVKPPHAEPPEDRLDWFRGDPEANDHHDHWHVVYPNIGLPVGDGEFKTKDRQGELFLYMHQQMLARYDAERLAVGLPPVASYENYREPIAAAYDPGDLQNGDTTYSPRPADTPLSDLASPAYRVVDHERRRERAVDAVDSSYVRHEAGTLPLTSDLLGATLEESIGTPDVGGRSRTGFYGNFHGMGHVLSALCTDPTGREGLPPGVMYDTAAAIRDPFFWQWHRHIDDYYFRWQERLGAHDFSDGPNVVFRDPTTRSDDNVSDLILATAAQVEGAGGTAAEYGSREFGGDRWTNDFTSGPRSTDTLTTRMLRRQIELAPGKVVEIEYLYPDDFFYFIRLENRAKFATRVTLRVFIAPEETVDNRRTWIEMDKFDHRLDAGERAVVARSSRESAVIRKPVVTPGTTPPAQTDESDESYCRCGWPYGLLLPRGMQEEGMPFRLFVMATDWNQDRVRQDNCCGSFSYCGAQDFYPDRRPMGYPFDRPLPADQPTFDKLVAARGNFASRPFRITWAG